MNILHNFKKHFISIFSCKIRFFVSNVDPRWRVGNSFLWKIHSLFLESLGTGSFEQLVPQTQLLWLLLYWMDVVTRCRWHHTLRARRLTYIIKHTKGPHTRKRRKRDNDGLWPLHFIKAEHFHYSRLLCSWTLYVRICFLSLMSLTNVTKSCPEELPIM